MSKKRVHKNTIQHVIEDTINDNYMVDNKSESPIIQPVNYKIENDPQEPTNPNFDLNSELQEIEKMKEELGLTVNPFIYEGATDENATQFNNKFSPLKTSIDDQTIRASTTYDISEIKNNLDIMQILEDNKSKFEGQPKIRINKEILAKKQPPHYKLTQEEIDLLKGKIEKFDTPKKPKFNQALFYNTDTFKKPSAQESVSFSFKNSGMCNNMVISESEDSLAKFETSLTKNLDPVSFKKPYGDIFLKKNKISGKNIDSTEHNSGESNKNSEKKIVKQLNMDLKKPQETGKIGSYMYVAYEED